MLAKRFNTWVDIINKDREPLDKIKNSIFNNNNNNNASNNNKEQPTIISKDKVQEATKNITVHLEQEALPEADNSSGSTGAKRNKKLNNPTLGTRSLTRGKVNLGQLKNGKLGGVVVD